MNAMFVRFGLPWLIFGSALYALYWTISNGESALSYTPAERSAKHSSEARPARHSAATSTTKTNHTAIQTSGQLVPDKSITPTAAPATRHEQRTLTPIPRNFELKRKVTTQDPQTNESNIHAALQDVDPSIRYHALAESDAQGIHLPAHTLQQMATSDRASPVRILAMTKFAQDPEIEPALVKAVVEAGLRDRDVVVNAHAHAMLEQLDRASRSNDDAPQLLPDDPTVE